jgi:pyrroloquinoline-quinone synthase
LVVSDTEGFIGALRAQSQRYHSRHPFHAMMNEGRLGRQQIQGWVANRFYYQENIPRKDAAILANCPDREVRRRWIRRIHDHVTFARTRPWVEAVASSLTELFAPDLMAERLVAFERFYTWIDPAGLAYFRARLTQAPRDSEHALEVVTEHCRTPEEQARAVAALSFKSDVLWSMLDAIEGAYSD